MKKVIRKWFNKRVVEPMVLSFLESRDLTLCKMCDNLAHVMHPICNYCEYELNVIQKQSYEEMMFGE